MENFSIVVKETGQKKKFKEVLSGVLATYG